MSLFQSKPHANAAVLAIPETGWPALLVVGDSTEISLVPGQAMLATSAKHLPDRLQKSQEFLNKKNLTNPSVQWVFSSFLLNTWLQPVPSGIASLNELRSVVQLRANYLFGPPDCGPEWMVTADWKSSGTMLCHAIPKAALEAAPLATAHSLLTLALRALQAVFQVDDSPRWCAITSQGEMHIVCLKDGDPLSIKSTRLSSKSVTSDHYIESIRGAWLRERSKTEWPPGKLHWLHLDTLYPLKHLPVNDIAWIDVPHLTKAKASLLGTDSDAAHMAATAWTLYRMGSAR